MANKRRQLSLEFPLGGLNRRYAYQAQPPFSSPDCLNVRVRETIEGRERGGSRPGLSKSHIDDLGSEVRMLAPMVLAPGDSFTNFADNFTGLSLAEAWTQASWASDVPSILPGSIVSVDTTTAEGEVVLDALPIDTAEAYSVELYLVPWAGEWDGSYRLYLRMDNTTPLYTTAGVLVEITQTGATGAYTATLDSYVASVKTAIDTASGTIGVRPGWLTVTVSGTTVTVYWNGSSIMSGTVGTHSGSRVGFGMECTEAGGLCLANTFRVQYYSTGSVPVSRSALYAAAGGDLYQELPYGRLTAITSALTVRDDVLLTSTQSGQALYIADYGDLQASGTDGTVADTSFDAASYAGWTALSILPDDMVVVISDGTGTVTDGVYKIASVAAGAITLSTSAGTGNCSYRIERAPKILDPLTNTLSLMTATTGQVPIGNPLICRYLDRIVLAGSEIAPHVWYMARAGSPLDWDYSQEDAAAAVAGTASDAGIPGDPITALVTHSDDYLIIGCRSNLWRMRGNPAEGGTLDLISPSVGIIGPRAWCIGPSGELIFLSLDGLYQVDPGGNAFPAPLSRDTLPREFLNIDTNSVNAQLEYDIQGRGVHIFLTTEPSNTRIHWWMDLAYKSFWPVSLDSDYEPTCCCATQGTAVEDSGVVLGCRDGYLRQFSTLAETDDGTAFDSYAVIGPIALSSGGNAGKLLSIDAALAEYSGDVDWEVAAGKTAQESLTATPIETGTWVAGLNSTVRPACTGQSMALTLMGETGRSWAVESIDAIRVDTGRRKVS